MRGITLSSPHTPSWRAQEQLNLYFGIFPTNSTFCILAHLTLLHKMYVHLVMAVNVFLFKIIIPSISPLISYISLFLCSL
jgi:hypothetical protein